MEKNEITFDKLPEAVAYLIEQVSELKLLVGAPISESPEKRMPIGIDEACRIISKAKPTIYTLVRKGIIPCYKRGKKLFFFEDELLEWITKGKRKTLDEVKGELEAQIYSKYPRR